MATHRSILAWKIPWTEDPGRLQSMGSQRVVHYLGTKQLQQYHFVSPEEKYQEKYLNSSESQDNNETNRSCQILNPFHQKSSESTDTLAFKNTVWSSFVIKKGFLRSSNFHPDLANMFKYPEPLFISHPFQTYVFALGLASELFFQKISLSYLVSQQVLLLLIPSFSPYWVYLLLFSLEFGIYCLFHCILMRFSSSKVCGNPPFFQCQLYKVGLYYLILYPVIPTSSVSVSLTSSFCF